MPEQQFYNPNQDFAQQIDDLRRRTAALELAAARSALGVAGDTVKGERIYNTTTDRDNTITSPVDGDFVYIDSADINEGPYWYDGSNWRRAWNLPWGVVASASSTSDQTGITTETDITSLTLTWTAVSNRLYLVVMSVLPVQNTSAAAVAVRIYTGASGSGTMLAAAGTGNTVNAGNATIGLVSSYVTGSGSTSVHGRALTTGGTLTIANGSGTKGWIVAQDMGPLVGAPA